MLKQTMLDQESTFRNQVLELHRLYRTQRTFMVDRGWKEFETCEFGAESSESIAIPVANPPRYSQLAVETTNSPISTVGSAQLLSQDISVGHHGVSYKFQQRPHNSHLPATQFFRNVGKYLPNRRTVWNQSQETMKLNCSLLGGDISDSDDLKLSLSIGDKKRRKGATDGKWLQKKTPYSHVIIDLEQDNEEMPQEDANHVPSLGCSAESQVSFLSDQIYRRSVDKDPSHSVVDVRECCQEQNSFSQGSKQCPDEVFCKNLPNMEQGGTSFKAGLLDLNKVYLDDSSCYSNDPGIYTPRQNGGAVSNLYPLCEDLGSHNSDSGKKTAESALEFPEGVLGRIQEGSASCQEISISDKLSGNRVGSEVAETQSVQLEGRSSGSSEVNHKGHSNKGKSSELDIFIQSAAESLVHISLENSAFFQKISTKEVSNVVENEQPDYSCDSYEALTLNLTENNVDEYSVSSKPFEVNNSEMKDFGLKLRRGRRFKDFQKEILPGLASLARHEICEDINIMEGVLRSREYRRLRGKMGDGESWSSPLSRRRSRGRRNQK